MDKVSMDQERLGFLKQLGATVGAGLGAAGLGTAGLVAGPRAANAAVQPKGQIPDKPLKVGHITFLTGPAELLGGPGMRGHNLAAEEINAEGGLLDRKSTRLNSSHIQKSRMPSSA